MSLLCGSNGAFDAAPGHHCGVVWQAALDDFIPTDQASVMCCQVLGKLCVEPALHGMCVFHAQFAHLGVDGV